MASHEVTRSALRLTTRLLSLTFAAGLVATAAGAQPADEASKVCDRQGFDAGYVDYPRYAPDEWPKEAVRYADNRANVSREGRRLRLRLDDGRSVDLVDCPHGDAAYGYLYERYDEAGGFYVVQKPGYEDFHYTLVMKRTGRAFTLDSAPAWADDKSRFMTVACSSLPPRGTLAIYALAGDGLRVEGEVELPCGGGAAVMNCAAHWKSQSQIFVTCSPRGAAEKVTPFVVMRGADGTWTRRAP